MPAPLADETTKVNWRIISDDLELLNLLYPGKVNEVARDTIHSLCEALRRKHFGGTQPRGI